MGTFDRDDARRGGRRAGRGRFRDGAGGPRGGPIRPVFGDDASGFGDKPDYKTAALCKQVRRLVALFLSGECGDPLLQSLIVEDVLPAPHGGRMLVRAILRIAEADAANANALVIDAIGRLGQVQGMLRAKVGEGIVRKRTPEIVFDVRAVSAMPTLAIQPEPEVRDE